MVTGRDELVDIPARLIMEHNATTQIWSDSMARPLKTSRGCNRPDRELVKELFEEHDHLLGVGRGA